MEDELVLITGVVRVGWGGGLVRQVPPGQRSAVSVQFEVTRGDLTQIVTAAGQLNPVTNVTVGCQISGPIAKLYVDWNSPVTNGQIVALIDPAIYRANLHSAEGDLANSEAAMELAKVNAGRSKELLANRLIPQSDDDQAVATLHQAEATVEIKRAALELAKVNLHYCTIYSPVDGMVISRNVDVGQTVAASLNAPTLFVIANAGEVEVRRCGAFR
jgi:HlyD family secretion protein